VEVVLGASMVLRDARDWWECLFLTTAVDDRVNSPYVAGACEIEAFQPLQLDFRQKNATELRKLRAEFQSDVKLAISTHSAVFRPANATVAVSVAQISGIDAVRQVLFLSGRTRVLAEVSLTAFDRSATALEFGCHQKTQST